MPLLSYSQISKYKECPRKYQLGTKYKEKTLSSALFFGTAIEDGVEAMLKKASFEEAYNIFLNAWTYAARDGITIKDNPEIEYYASDFDANLASPEVVEDYKRIKQAKADGVTLTETDAINFARYNWNSMAEKAEHMLKAFEIDILPEVKLIKVEGKPAAQIRVDQKISEEPKRKTSHVGYVDFVVEVEGIETPVVIDCKTASAEYTEHQLLSSPQLRTYIAGLQIKTGEKYLAGYWVLLKKLKKTLTCRECGWVATAPTYKNCKECKTRNAFDVKLQGSTQFMVADYEEEMLVDLVEDIKMVDNGIKNEVFFKNEGACMNYGRPCAFYDVCWKGESPDNIKNLTKKGKKK